MRQYKVLDRYEDRKELFVHETENLDRVGEIAFDLIRTNGFLTGCPDGEDSQGRAKMKLLSPEDLVDRAFAIAETFMSVAKDREHIVTAPDISAFVKDKAKKQESTV